MPFKTKGIFYFSGMDIEQLKFPIGKFKKPKTISNEDLVEAIKVLQIFPEQLKLISLNLKEEVLDSPYRPEGWTIRQLIHHISDSHHHCYNRIRWTLTEDKPTIKAYNQDAFAKLFDYQKAPIAWSLSHIEAVHQKIVYILQNLTEEQWERVFIHPETKEEVGMKHLAMLYSWHSMHHFTHIKNALLMLGNG